jgi:hypothetical protein
MPLWKTAHSSAPVFIPHVSTWHLDAAVLIVTAAAPVLLLVCLIPLPLVPPVLSIVSFMIAGIIALFARYSGVDRHAPGMTLWDVAGVFTLIWIGAAMISDPKHVIQFIDHLTIGP